MYYLKIRSKNHTANGLRRVVRSPKRAVLRLGSTTPLRDIYPHLRDTSQVVEINTIEACKVSGNKTLMKEAFDRADIVVMLVAHKEFRELPWTDKKVILDFCGIYKR